MKLWGFDTETTGLVNFKLPANHPSQPRLVQLAGKLMEDDAEGNLTALACLNVIVKPEGFTIPKEASDIHGTTHEKAMDIGIPLKVAMAAFSNLVALADRCIAHNFVFDAAMVARELHILKKPNRLAQKDSFCTMTNATDLCRLPPTQRMKNAGLGNSFKSPKLIEAHEFFLGVGFDKAHDALADVDAMFRIYPYTTGQKKKA